MHKMDKREMLQQEQQKNWAFAKKQSNIKYP